LRLNQVLQNIRYPFEELKKSNVRVYAVKSDDDSKTKIQYPEENKKNPIPGSML